MITIQFRLISSFRSICCWRFVFDGHCIVKVDLRDKQESWLTNSLGPTFTRWRLSCFQFSSKSRVLVLGPISASEAPSYGRPGRPWALLDFRNWAAISKNVRLKSVGQTVHKLQVIWSFPGWFMTAPLRSLIHDLSRFILVTRSWSRLTCWTARGSRGWCCWRTWRYVFGKSFISRLSASENFDRFKELPKYTDFHEFLRPSSRSWRPPPPERPTILQWVNRSMSNCCFTILKAGLSNSKKNDITSSELAWHIAHFALRPQPPPEVDYGVIEELWGSASVRGTDVSWAVSHPCNHWWYICMVASSLLKFWVRRCRRKCDMSHLWKVEAATFTSSTRVGLLTRSV